ncbi:hypothetical protein SUGI_0792860 [Cryptomeria japonica]|nr:hypothetical protein SUGI_0792860 [Cryptomeria japonica]
MEREEKESVHAPNMSYDFHGKVADMKRTGRWKASLFLLVNKVAERLAYYSITANMFSYLVYEMHDSIPHAANFVTNWIGASFVLTFLGAFVADAYWGHYKTIFAFSCIYAVGTILLLLNASISFFRPPECTAKCEPASKAQIAVLYFALYSIAIGTGGIKPCVSSFGANQFDETDDKERRGRYSFFNWFYFSINTGQLLGITVMVYVQNRYGWMWGFGIPTGATLVSILAFVCGTPYYRFRNPTGSPFTRFAQVLVASARKGNMKVDENTTLYEVKGTASAIPGIRKLAHTPEYRFLDKAAILTDYDYIELEKSCWSLCTVTQVEELKALLRVLPVWVSTIALTISFAQLSTYFVAQGKTLRRELSSNFSIPPPSLATFSTLSAILIIPFYDWILVPTLRKFTRIERGITSLQRIGTGLFISIIAMTCAAVIEKRRLEKAEDIRALDLHEGTLPMSVMWLVPQFFLMGTAEVYTYVGQMEFFFDEATDGTRSLSSSLFLSAFGIGSWLSTMIVNIIENRTGGKENGWLRNDLNRSRLDLFYWLLAGINMVNFFIFLVAAKYQSYSRFTSNAGADEVNSFPV